MRTTCDDCGRTGYRADNPDGTRQDGSHVPDGETVLVDSPEDGGAMLCDDCYTARRKTAVATLLGARS